MTAIAHVQDNNGSVPRLYLAVDSGDLWETMTALVHQPITDHFSIHIIIVALLKEASTIYRLMIQRPSKNLPARIKTMEDHIVCVRFALPPNYLSASRMTLSNESVSEHHYRLVNAIIMTMANIFLSIATILNSPEVSLGDAWCRTIEHCETVVSLIKDWNPEFLTTADPAMCFIVYGVLTLRHLYSKCEPTLSPETVQMLERHQNILMLFLKQFAAHWHLPTFLLGAS